MLGIDDPVAAEGIAGDSAPAHLGGRIAMMGG